MELRAGSGGSFLEVGSYRAMRRSWGSFLEVGLWTFRVQAWWFLRVHFRGGAMELQAEVQVLEGSFFGGSGIIMV